MIHDIVRLTSRRSMPVNALCLKLGVSEARLRNLVKQARRDEYNVSLVDGYVNTRQQIGANDVVPELGSSRPGRYSVAIMTDTHFGSKHCELDSIRQFLETAWERGARVAVCTGDLLDGNKEVLLCDQMYHGFDGQADLAVDTLRKCPPFKWCAIDGNHDGYFSASMGTTCGKLVRDRMVAAGLSWNFLGVCLGRARIHGANWHLWHPHGGASTRNAVRRVLNERAEAVEERIDVLAMGHFHKFVSLPIWPERVHGVAGGTFQSKGSEFSNRIARGWDVGGTIVSYSVNGKQDTYEVCADFVPASPRTLRKG